MCLDPGVDEETLCCISTCIRATSTIRPSFPPLKTRYIRCTDQGGIYYRGNRVLLSCIEVVVYNNSYVRNSRWITTTHETNLATFSPKKPFVHSQGKSDVVDLFHFSLCWNVHRSGKRRRKSRVFSTHSKSSLRSHKSS